jgi:hypothetical protein
MKRLLIALAATLPALTLGACAADYGYGGAAVYAGGPYAYDGFYDDYYGPIYDGYWGNDGFFYYRSAAHDRRFRRGDARHFQRGGPPPGDRFHPMQGSLTPQQGMQMPHFGDGDRGRHNRRDRHHD